MHNIHLNTDFIVQRKHINYTSNIKSQAVIQHVCVLAHMRLFALVMVCVRTCLSLYVNAWLLLLSAHFIHPDTDTFYSGCDQHFLGS